MNYIKKDLASYNLHLIKTKKFKTISVKVVFHTPIKKEEITSRNILTDILLQSSKKYKSRRELTIKSEDLYAVDLSTSNRRLGNYIFTSFLLQSLNDEYTEKGNFEASLEFLSEIIFNPDITNKRFNEEKLSIVKNNTAVALNSIKEDAAGYSLIRMTEAYDKDSPISYRMLGYESDLENITTENLYNTYKKMINNDLVDIFVVGDFETKEMTELIKKYFKFKMLKKKKEDYLLPAKKVRKRRLIAKETIENSQSKLAIACSLNKLTDYERNYALLLANIILGGGTDSKLFKEVREENSLCYTIRSSYNKLDNVLIITAGIDKKNFDKASQLITKCLNDMKKGKFTKKDIDTAKEFYKTSAEEVEEREERIINEYLLREILKTEDLKERIEKISKVTKQQITKACKKINMDTIFLLEGVKDENN